MSSDLSFPAAKARQISSLDDVAGAVGGLKLNAVHVSGKVPKQAATTGEPEVRQVAVYALGFFGGPSATKFLRERIQSDEDRFVRYNAAVALGKFGTDARPAIPNLVKEVSNGSSWEVRRAAVACLA